MNTINNILCCLIAAAVFAMVGLEAGNQATTTHSGTQELIRK